jgi:hypothetical protein
VPPHARKKKNLEKIANLQLRFLALPSHLTNKKKYLKTTGTTDFHTLHVPCSYKKYREVDFSPRVDFATTPTGLIALVESKKESEQVNVSSIRAEQVS